MIFIHKWNTRFSDWLIDCKQNVLLNVSLKCTLFPVNQAYAAAAAAQASNATNMTTPQR